MGMANRESEVYMAKLAEQAERYDEMVTHMKAVAELKTELTVEERNLLSVAFKNVIGARRASWRIMGSIEQKEESKDNADHVKLIKEYRAKIEKELDDTCADILKVLDDSLLPSAESGESKVFYNKMKGDYHRYLAEFKTGEARDGAAKNAQEAYETPRRSCRLSSRRPTRSASAWPSTTRSSSTRSPTPRRRRASSPSRRSTMPSPSSTPSARTATRTARSLCSFSATT